jgi:hypothetical protein
MLAEPYSWLPFGGGSDGRGRKVVNHYAHVIHALDRHALDGGDRR